MKGYVKIKLWCCLLLAAGLSFSSFYQVTGDYSPIQINSLHCEYLQNPLGIDIVKPQLNWGMSSLQRGEKQRAYQILVASSPYLLNKNEGDLWNTHKVVSSRSAQIVYQGVPLRSRMQCYWKVRYGIKIIK